MPTPSGKAWGGLCGLLIRDALGVPYEFHRAVEIPPAAEDDFPQPHGYAES